MTPKSSKRGRENKIKKIKKKREYPEFKLQCAFVKYIKEKYPNILFNAEIRGPSVNLGPIVGKMCQMKGCQVGYPDFYIYETNDYYSGLFIEFKALNKKVSNSGEQSKIIEKLFRKGYYTTWTDHIKCACDLLDWYMKLPKTKTKKIAPIFLNNKTNDIVIELD
jgi:hypothetical protein